MAAVGETEAKRWEVQVGTRLESMEFQPFRRSGPCWLPHCGRQLKTNPHMRAFWAATLASCFAFIGWFAFAPLLPVIRVDLGLCDNNAEIQRLPEDLRVSACDCGQACRSAISTTNVAAVSLDVLMRFGVASVVGVFGPRKTDCMLLSLGALAVLLSGAVQTESQLITARLFVSCLGSTAAVNQFWNSIMFSRSAADTADAMVGGWGNFGGGLTQILMPLSYVLFKSGFGLSLHLSWRLSMVLPAAMYVILVTWIYFGSQDTPTGKFDAAQFMNVKRNGLSDYVRVAGDFRVFLMFYQYSACFGTTLVFNNVLASHFHDTFGIELTAAGGLAMSFGAMSLLARPLGGVASDWANSRWEMRGRLWAQFLSLFGQAVFMFALGCIDKSIGDWPAALAVLLCCAIFANMAESTSSKIVPYMFPEDQDIVSAVVCAGGTVGAVVATWLFYSGFEDVLLPFKFHAIYVMFWALSVPFMHWDHLGSMFRGPAKKSPGQAEQPVAAMAASAEAANFA